jgi:hypothetical protein
MTIRTRKTPGGEARVAFTIQGDGPLDTNIVMDQDIAHAADCLPVRVGRNSLSRFSDRASYGSSDATNLSMKRVIRWQRSCMWCR